MDKYHGELQELKDAVARCGLKGEWVEKTGTAESHLFKATSGENLSWWPKKGTLLFQGKNQSNFSEKLEQELGHASPAPAVISEPQKKIFIVHGHDSEARDQLELILMRLGLLPFILQNSDGGGDTIIEALERNIYENTSFGIIFMTPDDFGYPKTKEDADRQPRARQNVILEMGMVMAKLTRTKMVILKKGALEMPSDCDGILRLDFNGHVKEIVPKLVQRLQSAGFTIDPGKIAGASA